MITIENLEVAYDKKGSVLKSLNLQLTEGSIHGIIGLNGSGKTTLLNTIFGLTPSESGTILHNSQPISKKDISFLPTENFFYSYISGREYLEIFKNKSFNTDKWNELFKLPLDTMIEGYSTGMKKKLALLSILKQEKSILILDEPFNGMDMESCRIVRQVLLQAKVQNKTIIITSHILETLFNLCDSIHFIEDGKIKFSRLDADFHTIEADIFHSFESKNQVLIDELMTRKN